jgi:hypothetical protein
MQDSIACEEIQWKFILKTFLKTFKFFIKTKS